MRAFAGEPGVRHRNVTNVISAHKVPCLDGDGMVTCGGGDATGCTSARNHGGSDDTMLHAFNKRIRTEDLDEGLTMLIGPDHAGNLFEIGVVDGADGPIIVHAMAARDNA